MNTPEASFLTWQQQFSSDDDCIEHLKNLKWPEDYIRPRCGHGKGVELRCRKITE